MKLRLVLPVLATLVQPLYAEPILLATIPADEDSSLSFRVEAMSILSILQYEASTYGPYNHSWATYPLFEEEQTTVWRGVPTTVSQTATNASDPDFYGFVQLLTDGISSNTTGQRSVTESIASFHVFNPNSYGWRSWNEDVLDVIVPRYSMYDLLGYDVDRIDRNLTYTLVSPGSDPNGDGIWADIHVEGSYEIWGSPIPEPATLSLLATGLMVLVSRGSFCRRVVRRKSTSR